MGKYELSLMIREAVREEPLLCCGCCEEGPDMIQEVNENYPGKLEAHNYGLL